MKAPMIAPSPKFIFCSIGIWVERAATYNLCNATQMPAPICRYRYSRCCRNLFFLAHLQHNKKHN